MEDSQIIFMRILHPDLPDYVAVIFSSILINPSPIIERSLQLGGCFSTIDLRRIAHQLEAGLTFTFFETELDAENGLNPIDISENYSFYTGETIFLRGYNNADCFTVAELNLTKISCIFPQGISPNGDGKNDSFDLSRITAASGGAT